MTPAERVRKYVWDQFDPKRADEIIRGAILLESAIAACLGLLRIRLCGRKKMFPTSDVNIINLIYFLCSRKFFDIDFHRVSYTCVRMYRTGKIIDQIPTKVVHTLYYGRILRIGGGRPRAPNLGGAKMWILNLYDSHF